MHQRVGIGFGEGQPDLAHGDPDAGADFQQLQPDRRALCLGMHRTGKTQSTQAMQQHVSKRREVQAELVCPQRRGARATGKQPQLLLLDAILHIAAGTVEGFIEALRTGLTSCQIGHDKARVGLVR